MNAKKDKNNKFDTKGSNNSNDLSNSRHFLSKKKIAVAGLTVLLCLSAASVIGNISKTNNGSKNTKETEDDNTPIVETTQTKTLTPEFQKMLSASVSKKAANINPIGKEYISKNIDTKYAKVEKFELANVFLFKNTIIDGNKAAKNETINSLYERGDTGDVFITQIAGETALYNTDDSSKYYVAYTNTMLKDKSAKVLDVAFAKNNNDGEVVDGCIYDNKTGIVYIPKSLYDVKDEKTHESKIAYENIQVQFLQAITQKTADINSYYEYSQSSPNKALRIGSDTTHSLNLESKVQTEAGLSKKDILVSVNGLPLMDDNYDYNSSTGVVTLNSSSLGIQNISVNITKDTNTKIKSLSTKISNLIPASDVSAISSMNDMGCAGGVDPPSNVGVDYASDYTLFTGYSSDDGKATLPTYGVGSSNQSAANYAHFLCYENISNFKYSNYSFQSTSMHLGVYLWDEYGKYPSFWNWGSDYVSGQTQLSGWLRLQCAHITKATTYNYNPLGVQPWDDKWKNTTIRIRVLDKSSQYIVVGFLTKQINSQSGHGIAKFRIRPRNTTLTVYPNGGSLDTGVNFTRTTDAKLQMIYNTSNYWSLGTASRAGYTFDGFWTDPNGGTQVFYSNGTANNNGIHWVWTGSYPAWRYESDLTVYAHWIRNTFTVSYNSNGGDSGSMSSDTVSYGDSYYTKANGFGKTGYYFTGWNEKADGSGTDWTSWINRAWTWSRTKDVTLYAQWAPNTYKVAYNRNGGTGNMSSDTVTYNTNYITKSNKFKRTGYTFTGWNEKANGSGTDWTSWIGKEWKWTYTKNIILYAQWIPNQYIAKWHPNGGTLNVADSNITKNSDGTAQTKVTYEQAYFYDLGITASKKGYQMKGFYNKATGGIKVWNNGGKCLKDGTYWNSNNLWIYRNNADFYAQWTPNKYKIVYHPQAPSYSSDIVTGTMTDTECTYDQEATLRKNIFSLNNHTFLGWSTSKLTPSQENSKTEKNKAIVYKDAQTVKNLTDKNNGVIDLYPVWDEAPTINTKFRKYLKGKDVDTANLLRYVTSNDREDGDLTNKVKIKQIKYSDTIDTNPTKLDTSVAEDDIVVTVTVTDSVGNVTEQIFYVSVYEEKQEITEPTDDTDIRFITGSQASHRYYLKDSSNWKTDSVLSKKIEDSFDSRNNGTDYVYDSSSKRWVRK